MIGLGLLFTLGFAGLLALAFDTGDDHAGDDDTDPPVDPPGDDQYGTEGDDTLMGGNDGDRIFGRGGDDRISGIAGNNWLRGGDGNDTLSGGMAHDTLLGDEGDDELRGGSGDDSLLGGMGEDTLAAGYGADTLLGGEGHDRLLGYLRGQGSDGHDLLDGGEGYDTLSTGEGATNSTLVGGDGSDTFYVDGVGNLVIAGNGEDYIATRLGNTVDLGGETNGAVEDIVRIDASNTSAGPVVISGFDSTNHSPSGDQDVIEIFHLPGDGFTTADDGDDLVISSGGVQLIRLTGLAGASLHDVMPDARYETGFVDTGTDADEIFVDGYGDDLISGMGGNDRITSFDGEDTLLGGAGNDILSGVRPTDTGDWDDYLSQPLTDAALLDGGSGDDTLYGENGDTLSGGAGNDLHIINAFNVGHVTVSDFTSGEDRLGFLASTSYFYGPVTLGWTAPAVELEQEVLADGSGLMVHFYEDGAERVSVLLEGVSDTLPADQLLASEEDILGTSGNDTLVSETDVYRPGGVFGLAGDDVLYAHDPEELADYHDNYATLSGGLGNDTLYAGQSRHACLDGGNGDDLLYSGAFFAPEDTGHTTPLQSQLSARLSGGNGNDTLVASASDSLSGGAGIDRFEVCGEYNWERGADQTLITDFETGEQIVLTDAFGTPMTDLITQELTDEGLRIFVPGANYEGVFLPGMTRLLTQTELPQAYS